MVNLLHISTINIFIGKKSSVSPNKKRGEKSGPLQVFADPLMRVWQGAESLSAPALAPHIALPPPKLLGTWEEVRVARTTVRGTSFQKAEVMTPVSNI